MVYGDMHTKTPKAKSFGTHKLFCDPENISWVVLKRLNKIYG